ncbi:MAG: phosphohistidine phosphatase SixA [Nitrospirota bacterium]
MYLYLVQHGAAKTEEEDPLRPLSSQGYQDITRVSTYLSRLNISVDTIMHSAKLRARQTAEVLREYLRPMQGISEKDGLSPLDNPEIWKERLTGMSEDLFLIGHLPHLARLASLLLCGHDGKHIVRFQMAGVVCLERNESGIWSLQWMITPRIIAGETAESCDSL